MSVHWHCRGTEGSAKSNASRGDCCQKAYSHFRHVTLRLSSIWRVTKTSHLRLRATALMQIKILSGVKRTWSAVAEHTLKISLQICEGLRTPARRTFNREPTLSAIAKVFRS